jgi:hypothetical protein
MNFPEIPGSFFMKNQQQQLLIAHSQFYRMTI